MKKGDSEPAFEILRSEDRKGIQTNPSQSGN